MNQIELKELSNQYPTIESYIKHSDDTIRLEGIYPEKNVIYFKINPIGTVSIDNVQTFDNTSFKFILAITNGDGLASNAKLYTSPGFKAELKASIQENNPYFYRDALKIPFIVHYSLLNSRKIVNNLVNGKTPSGEIEKDPAGVTIPPREYVTMYKYNFIKATGEIDYEKLVRYIDWVVSTPSALSEINTNNVLSINKILDSGDYTKTPFILPTIPAVNINASLSFTRSGPRPRLNDAGNTATGSNESTGSSGPR